MDHIDTRTLIEQYFRCFNERRFTDAAALLADGAEIELVSGRPEYGAAGYQRVADVWMTAFPNATFSVERVDERSEQVSEVYLFANGTHRGVFDLGAYRFAPTGGDVVLHVRNLLAVRDGKITASIFTLEIHDLIDQLTRVDYDELIERIDRICVLRVELAAAGDSQRRRDVTNRLGIELDAARRAVRPHFNR